MRTHWQKMFFRALPLLALANSAWGQVLVSPGSLPRGVQDQPYSVTLTATGGTAPYTFSIVQGSLPLGVTLNPNGQLSGTPTVFGDYPLVILATSAGGAPTGTAGYTLTIGTIFCPDTNIVVGSPFNNVVTSFPTATSIALVGGALPPGVSLSTNGQLSGTPTTEGAFTPVFQATVSGGAPFTRACPIYTNSRVAPMAPLSVARLNIPYRSFVSATGASGPYTFALQSGTLPPGLSLSGATGAITGTPTALGNFTFTLTITDSLSRFTTATYSINVIPRGETPPTLRCPAPSAGSGTSYSSGLSINFPGTVTFSISSGSLPSGLTLNPSTGAITGTPGTLVFENFTAVATPSAGQPVSAQCTIKSDEGSFVYGAGLCLDQRDFVVGEPVSTFVPGITTFRPLRTELYQTSLPPGLTLNSNTGFISGIPTAPGNGLVAFRFIEPSGNFDVSALCPFSVITPPPLSLSTTTPLTSGIVGQPYSVQRVAAGGIAPLTFTTSGGLPPGITLSSSGLLSGVPSQANSFAFTVLVTDAAFQTASRLYAVSIAPPNPLRFGSQVVPSGTVGVPYSFDFDIQGGAPPYSAQVSEGSVPGVTLSGTRLTGTPTVAGGWPLTVLVRDSAGGSISGNFTVNISQGALRIGCPAFSGEVGVPYSSTAVVLGGSGPYEFRLLEGALPAGLSLNAASGEVSGRPTQSGAATFTLGVTAAGGLSTAARCAIGIVGGALRILTSGPIPTMAGRPYTGVVEAAGGRAPYTFGVLGNPAPGLNLATNGNLGGTAALVGEFRVAVEVTDAAGAKAQANILFRNTPNEMRFTCPAPSELPVGAATAISLLFTNGVSPYRLAVATGALPPGVVFGNPNPAGLLNAIAQPTEPGTFNFSLRGEDSTGTTVTQSCTLRVTGSPLTIVTDALPGGRLGADYSAAVVSSGGIDPVRTGLLSGELPPGVALDPATGSLSGTPIRPGTYSANYEVRDRLNRTARRALSITVEDGALPLTITTLSPLSDAVVGRTYSQSFDAEGGRPPFTFTLAGSPPAGLTFDSGISGTPTATGESSVTVTVRDAGGATAAKTFALRVLADPALNILTETLPDGVLAENYAPGVTALGGTPPYRWAIISGRLPAGVSFQAQGSFTGTPTVTGQFDATLLVEDATGAVSRRAYRFEVRTPGADRLEITTASLPPANVGVPYSASLASRGGQPPYRWSVRGLPPPGITISEDGQLSGMVAAVGGSRFVAVVSDALGLVATREFNLPVTATVAPASTLTGLPETLGSNASAPFGLTVSRPLAVATTLRLTLRFTPDPIHNTDDAAVRFGNQSRTIDVTLPAQATSVTIPGGAATVQTGTLAGTIVITSEYNVGGATLPGPGASITIRRAPPVISAVRLTRSGGALEVRVEGFTNTRQLAEARLTFTFAPGVDVTGANSATVNVASAIQSWFASPASIPFGGQFGLTLPFSVTGDPASVTSVAVVLTNGEGASTSVSNQ